MLLMNSFLSVLMCLFTSLSLSLYSFLRQSLILVDSFICSINVQLFSLIHGRFLFFFFPRTLFAVSIKLFSIIRHSVSISSSGSLFRFPSALYLFFSESTNFFFMSSLFNFARSNLILGEEFLSFFVFASFNLIVVRTRLWSLPMCADQRTRTRMSMTDILNFLLTRM